LTLLIDELYIPLVDMPSQPTNVCKTFNDDDYDNNSSNTIANNNSSVANRIQNLISMEVEARSTLLIE